MNEKEEKNGWSEADTPIWNLDTYEISISKNNNANGLYDRRSIIDSIFVGNHRGV